MSQDGNVIHPPCWHPTPPEPNPAFYFEMLYLDEFVALGRLTFRVGNDVVIQHIFYDGAE